MLNLNQLRYYADSVRVQIDSNRASVYRGLAPYYRYASLAGVNTKKAAEALPVNKTVVQLLPEKDRAEIIQRAIDQVHMLRDELNRKKAVDNDYLNSLNGFIVQLHKKYTLSVSCLVLFFIGAPLGAIIRKGGLGLPLVVAIACFLFYHIISTIGEKSVKEGSMSEFVGMWIAVIVLTPIGAFITYKAAHDSVLLDIDTYRRFFKKLLKKWRRKNK